MCVKVYNRVSLTSLSIYFNTHQLYHPWAHSSEEDKIQMDKADEEETQDLVWFFNSVLFFAIFSPNIALKTSFLEKMPFSVKSPELMKVNRHRRLLLQHLLCCRRNWEQFYWSELDTARAVTSGGVLTPWLVGQFS